MLDIDINLVKAKIENKEDFRKLSLGEWISLMNDLVVPAFKNRRIEYTIVCRKRKKGFLHHFILGQGMKINNDKTSVTGWRWGRDKPRIAVVFRKAQIFGSGHDIGQYFLRYIRFRKVGDVQVSRKRKGLDARSFLERFAWELLAGKKEVNFFNFNTAFKQEKEEKQWGRRIKGEIN